MKHNPIKISHNFWAELEGRGFLDRNNTGGTSQLDFLSSIEKAATGEYKILNTENKSLVCFVNSEVFLKALRLTEEKVKYRLFS